MRILKENTVALIIDIQERLFPFIHDNEMLTKNTRRLIEGLKVMEIPVMVTQQYTKGLGATISPLAEVMGRYEHIEKMAFSCCDDDDFNSALKATGKKNIIITGIEAHVCVFQTTIDLLEQGYIPVVVEDCISSRNINDKRIAVERMRQEGAIVTTYESLLFELLRYSGTDQFRAISKIVK